MIFKTEKDENIEINHYNYRAILRGGILGSELALVLLQDGTTVWVKASNQEILSAGGYYR